MCTVDDFNIVDLRVGTIVKAVDFLKARKPAYQLEIDFGHLGIKKSSAQITTLYDKDQLIHRQVVAVVNFPKKQIANFMSECLILGAVNDNQVTLLHPEQTVPNGTQIS